jgi:MFS family permease
VAWRIIVSDLSRAEYEPLTLTKWLILIMAAIGFAFDIYELLMLPLILPPALAELLPHAPPGSDTFNLWRGLMFWVPAMAGGVFGLLGGYLTDRLGRRRVLTWSILLYAFSAFAAGYSTSMPMLLILRCTTFIGVCVEFVAAVAWLAELFPQPHQRENALGYTQAFSSVGGFLVGGANLLAIKWASELPAISLPEFLSGSLGQITGSHAPWRYTLMSGLIPAIPLIVIRPFLPESPVWQQKKAAGTLKRPSIAAIFTPAFLQTTVVTTIMVACSYGAAFGAIQQLPQIVPGIPTVQAEVQAAKEAAREEIDAAVTKARTKLEEASKSADEIADALKKERARQEKKIAQTITQETAAKLSLTQEVGGLTGRFLLALLAVRIVSRRGLLRVFQWPGLILVPLVFAFATSENQDLFTLPLGDTSRTVRLLDVGVFLAGLLTVAQFSFWGNYLPRVYPVHLRGTGESFAANIGGRMIGTAFAAVTSTVSGFSFIPGDSDPARVAYTAAGVAAFVFLLGSIACCFLPEPKESAFKD